jgi:hypothetical protein
MRRLQWLTLAVLAMLSIGPAIADEPVKPAAPASEGSTAEGPAASPDQASLEEEFAELMSGATLIGSYTDESGDGDEEPPTLHQEKYTLGEVKKLKDNRWRFEVRIQYGDQDVTLPLPLEVKWAGDTPVITLSDMEMPNLGTFTARVVIFQGQYAGTWSGGGHGGHLFGRVVKPGEEPARSEKTEPAPED